MIVDTDIIIWYMRDNRSAIALLDANKGFYISVVTYMELVQGLKNKKEFKALTSALRIWRTKILQIDETASTKAMFYVEHYFLSHSLRIPDALISATAVTNKLPLYSGNSKHFSVINELDFCEFRP